MSPAVSPVVLPVAPERVGGNLRAARERQGLTLAEVASRTRVPMRHLAAIEQNDFTGLPSLTYATGFARAYARAVGLDEVETAREVRAELAGTPRPAREYQPYQATDPSRVPSRGVTLMALVGAIAVLVLAGLWFATDLFRGRTAEEAVPAVVAPTVVAPAAAPVSAPAPGGQVLVTATDKVWVRIYDAADKTLHQGILPPGEHFEVPGDATDPRINVGRPDKLKITVNGSLIQGLKLGDQPVKDVRVSAAALMARPGSKLEAARPQSTPSELKASEPTPPSPKPSPSATPSARPTSTAATPTRPSVPPRRADPPARSEAQRANAEPAATPLDVTPPPGNTQ